MDWESNILWGVLGILGGLIVSIIFFNLSRKTKRIQHEINSTLLVTDKMSEVKGLSIEFKGEPIPNMVSTDIVIMNTGNDTIEPLDFASKDPLSLKIDNGIFLIYNSANDFIDNNVNALIDLHLESLSSSTLKINFDYIEKGDVIILHLLHTGKVTVHGTLKKGKHLADLKTEKYEAFSDELKLFGLMFVVVAISIFRIIGFTSIATFLTTYAFINYAISKYSKILLNNEKNQTKIKIDSVHVCDDGIVGLGFDNADIKLSAKSGEFKEKK